jgi:hypothetical protein
MKRPTPTLFIAALLVATLSFLYSCESSPNPTLSTSDTAPISDHTINLGGYQHANGYCQALNNCTPCHGAKLEGEGTTPACTECHTVLWNNVNCGTGSHSVALGGKLHRPDYCAPYQNCTSCHGQDLRGGANGEPSCLKCHTQSKWKNCGTVQHNRREEGVLHAMNNKKPEQDCTPCHGANLRGGPNGESSCYKCHGKEW